MNRPVQAPCKTIAASQPQPSRRLMMFALLLGYLTLVFTAWHTGSEFLAAFCVLLLVSAVLARGLISGQVWAWAAWILLGGGIIALASNGHGRIALDLVPVAINLGLAVLFGQSLTGKHSPLIARAIVAIEGRDRLALPRVAGYARALTAAWTLLFALQVVMFIVLLTWWFPQLSSASRWRTWGTVYLHVGGYVLPAIFMLCEYVFRRWYLRHVPHVSPQQFFSRLIQNWPQLLRDSGESNEQAS